MSVKVSLKL